jgi:hypothetical protein
MFSSAGEAVKGEIHLAQAGLNKHCGGLMSVPW